jgi:hypothetical protein
MLCRAHWQRFRLLDLFLLTRNRAHPHPSPHPPANDYRQALVANASLQNLDLQGNRVALTKEQEEAGCTEVRGGSSADKALAKLEQIEDVL